MPTILNIDGYRIVIWGRDHEPPHVHIFKAGGETIVNLEPVSLRDVEGMSGKEVKRAVDLVKKHQEMLLAKWREIHG